MAGAVLAALALAGCASTRDAPAPAVQSQAQCWGDYTASGERNGPFACGPDGVSPDYSRPILSR